MSTKDTPTQLSEQEKLLFFKIQVALAVAIIKTKPQGLSGREYSEMLASNLKKNYENWQQKAKDLETEVLRLKQELLLQKINKQGEVSEVFSEDLFAPVRDSTEKNLESDSETPDLMLDVQTNTYLPPPVPQTTNNAPLPGLKATTKPSQTETEGATSDFCISKKIQDSLPHVQFLQSLCSLQRFSPSSEPLCLGLGAPEGGAVLEESVSQLLLSILGVFTASAPSPGPPCGSAGSPCGSAGPLNSAIPGPSVGTLAQACHVSVRALEVLFSNSGPSVDFSKRLEEIIKQLLDILVTCKNQNERSDHLIDCLMALSHCHLLKCFLIRHIVSHLSSLTDRIWGLFRSSDPDLVKFPMVQFQNSCQLMWILEQLLHSNAPIREGDSSNGAIRTEDRLKQPIRVDSSSDQSGFIANLQQRVFPLSQEFPLFSVYLWRVLGLLSTPGLNQN